MRRTTSVLLLTILVGAVRSPAAAQERAPATIREMASAQQAPDSGLAPPARDEPDTLLNGTLIGAGVGFATGFFGLAAFNAKETASGPLWDGEEVVIYASAGMVGAGIGAGIGAIVDAIRRPPRRVAPGAHPTLLVAPVYGPQRRAVMVSIAY